MAFPIFFSCLLSLNVLMHAHIDWQVRDEIEHLLDDDDDMAEMYLTDKLSVESDLENSSASSSMDELPRNEMDDEIHQAADVDDRHVAS